MNVDEYNYVINELAKRNHPKNYLSNNRYAYHHDKFSLTSDSKYKILRDNEMKTHNFVPTYDKWCLFCNTGCKTIYFCSKKCQLAAWSIHKNHCKRDQFMLCSFCGSETPDSKCESCPVKFCTCCKDKIYKEYDCNYFASAFNS